jgi:hypothetical protein
LSTCHSDKLYEVLLVRRQTLIVFVFYLPVLPTFSYFLIVRIQFTLVVMSQTRLNVETSQTHLNVESSQTHLTRVLMKVITICTECSPSRWYWEILFSFKPFLFWYLKIYNNLICQYLKLIMGSFVVLLYIFYFDVYTI